MTRMRLIPGLMVSILAVAGIWIYQAMDRARTYDLVVRNGTVIDGTGAPGTRTDIGIRAGRIATLGSLRDAKAGLVIDATGLVVAPGFIDVHTHADNVAETPLAENFLRMGVTSVVAGNCGDSAEDIGAALEAIREKGVAVNFATLVGHNTVRQAVMGRSRRAPTAGELKRMEALVARAMDQGAIGLSSGLQYVPGSYAERDELVALARAAASRGGLYATHMRNEGTEIEEAVAEAIAIGEAAHCPVQISHLKIDSPKHWGNALGLLGLIDEARRRGVAVSADQYAYTAGASSLGIRFPDWALEGGRNAIRERLDDPATWSRIKGEVRDLLAARGFEDLSWATVAAYSPEPSFNGLTMKEVAQRMKGADSLDAQLEAAREMMRQGGAQMIYHFIAEGDVTTIMRHPHVSIASDSGVLTPGRGMPHPRGYGNTVRVLGRYSREQKVLPLEEAVRKMTSLPAAQFGFADRGAIRPGLAADLVLFDPSVVADRATFEAPHQYARGVVWVVVNGVVVMEGPQDSGARPGQLLRRTPPSTAVR